MTIKVRPELEVDYSAIHKVNEIAFGRINEADLVDTLRQAAIPHISMVAVQDGGAHSLVAKSRGLPVKTSVVGHIFFSPVSVESDSGRFTAVGLAPMAVLPDHQRRGIGSQLVSEGLKACRQIGYDLVFVVGHADYYPRFGFKPARQLGFDCEYAVPDEVFMVAELKTGAVSGRNGMVRYLPQFRSV
jgi:putative acetyltransferase